MNKKLLADLLPQKFKITLKNLIFITNNPLYETCKIK